MYLDICQYRRGARSYRRELLRESRRVGGKVCKRTVANISGWPEGVKDAIRQALDANRDGRQERTLGETVAGRPGFFLRQGKSVGALYLLHQIAGELGLPALLGADRQGRLALWQVLARTQDQGSRLSAVRLAREQTVAEVLGLEKLTEDDLYANLDWLEGQQARIEAGLFRKRYAEGRRPSLFLYDVTSTYLEGRLNELAAFGYNRDGKRGKKQLVVGLLADQDGWPLAVEVFRGNTCDPATVDSQIRKLAERFGGGEVTLVGDRGMLKRPQTAALVARGMHYITAITKPQIEALLKAGTLQMELFDAEVAEVTASDERVRYVLRRNPMQAERVAARRADQLAAWTRQVLAAERYLAAHPRAGVDTQIRRLTARAVQLKLDAWVRVEVQGRSLRPVLDEAARAEQAKLDGCYVLKTDLTAAQASAATVDARYRDLAQVEWAFRTCKTAFLEIRPVYVRREARTRGHALVVMLSYLLARRLAECWRDIDLTVEEGLQQLAQLCVTTVEMPQGVRLHEIPQPRENLAELLAAAGVTLPSCLAPRKAAVDTTVKLQSRRK
jgi:hypothetical protein